jgi:perosamine synthetase
MASEWSRWSPHPRFRLYTSVASYVPSFAAPPDALEQLEAEICVRFQVAAAVCVPMARTGLYLTLIETIRPGQKVIMSPLTIIDVVNAVVLAGGVPVFADICRETCGLDPAKVEDLIDDQTGAVLVTHLHGQTAGARVFAELCERRGVRLIEDAAQAFGAVEGGRYLGTVGHAGVYSFGFYKNLSAWRGGMVVSNDRKLVDRLRMKLRDFSAVPARQLFRTALLGLIVDMGTWPPVFSQLAHRLVRMNLAAVDRRLDPESGASRLAKMPNSYLAQMRPWQADLALNQLNRVAADTKTRIELAMQYHAGLEGLAGIVKPPVSDDGSNIYTYFPIQVRNRADFLRYAQSRGRDIAAQHLRNCADLSEFREFSRDSPSARAAAAELVLLPTYPRYPASQAERNIGVLREFLKGVPPERKAE